MRPTVFLFAVLLVTPTCRGFVQPHSRACLVEASTTRIYALDEAFRTGFRAFLVGKKAAPPPPPPPIEPSIVETPPVDESSFAQVARLFENTGFVQPKLPSLFSDPWRLGDKISVEVNEWGEMFRAGAERSWTEVGGGLRESAAESANLLFQASKNSIQYFTTELAVSWETQAETRRVLGEEAKLVGESLLDLGPYVQSNAVSSWESSSSLREGVQQLATSVVPFVQQCFSYFASNAGASWENTGTAWRDDVVQTTSNSVQDFGPYFLNNLASSWEASEPIRPVVGCLLVGSWLVLQLRQQQKAKESRKPRAWGGINLLQPLFQSSASNAQAVVDRASKNIPVPEFQKRLLETRATIPKGIPTANSALKNSPLSTFLGVSAAPKGFQMAPKKAPQKNRSVTTFLGVPSAPKGGNVVRKLTLKKTNMSAKKQMAFSFL